jgi:hypothetical protein
MASAHILPTPFQTAGIDTPPDLTQALQLFPIVTLTGFYRHHPQLRADTDELHGYANKIKPTVLLTGMIYARQLASPVRYGVIEAVNEFCVTKNYRIRYFKNGDIRKHELRY